MVGSRVAEIRTPKFHLVDGPASDELREAVEGSSLPVPPSYRQSVLRFGNCRLYRQGNIYGVEVFAGPRQHQSVTAELLLHIGRAGCSQAYFKEDLLAPGKESPVFEWRYRQGLRQAADGFEEWLERRCRVARKTFRKHEWEAILNGPLPFSAEERAIVEARRKFRWRIVGVSQTGDMQFEVTNGSDRVLPYLTIGVRAKSGKLHGGVSLSVASVRPGQTRIVEQSCYKKLLSPDDVEAFEVPDPGPEDREMYREFRWVQARPHQLRLAGPGAGCDQAGEQPG